MNRNPEASLDGILKSYRSDGPFIVPRAADIAAWCKECGIDPRTPHPWLFDYESLAHFRQEGVVALFSAIDIKASHAVLSLGEGNGGPSRLLAKLVGCHVTGVDVNPAQLSLARECSELAGVARLIDLVEQDAHDLDLGSRRFDRFYDSETMCHWRYKDVIMERVRRHLKPGAILGFNEWLLGDRGDLNDVDFPIPYEPNIWFQSTLQETSELLKKLGFEVLSANDVTDEVDNRLRRRLAALKGFEKVLDECGLRGIPYFEAMNRTHYKFLRYGRLIARMP